MGLAKKKLFKKPFSLFPQYQKWIDEGLFLDIDLAYAHLQASSEDEILTQAALLAALRQGHLCLTKSTVDPSLSHLVEEQVALPKYEHYQNQIIHHVKRLLAVSPTSATHHNPTLTAEQGQAVTKALTHRFSLITGGPGTGKTYTASQICLSFTGKVILTAPTGKAATNLASKVEGKAECTTLHSLLKIKTPLDLHKTPDPLEANLIIVDECTMIDPILFAKLLSAIEETTTLVLMGDPNQLPAVEGGSIFADLIDTKLIPTTHLTRCMRSDRLEILNLAQSILDNTAQDIRTLDLGFADNDLEKIYTHLWRYVKDQDFATFRILSTLRKGPLGVDALNQFLFEKFSKQTDIFPIMIRKNDSRTGLTNGEAGLLKGDTAYFADRSFPLHTLPAYEYAYCLSVHKSQGSEYDHVLLLVPEGSEVFGKEVLYTAVTRAKKRLAIDGNPQEIRAALQRTTRKASLIHK